MNGKTILCLENLERPNLSLRIFARCFLLVLSTLAGCATSGTGATPRPKFLSGGEGDIERIRTLPASEGFELPRRTETLEKGNSISSADVSKAPEAPSRSTRSN